tara:strand:- start:366 stop:818 length:453 start_codon:yes stop_codon:yes gene_type:complete
MRFISHRGNLDGSNPDLENHPDYIIESINKGYDCEIDVWYIDDVLFLGHDSAQYKIELSFLNSIKSNLWIHCKNIDAVLFFRLKDFNFFWHEKDKVTLTSNKNIWAFPGNQPIDKSIAVMPEIFNENNLNKCLGICSDYILKYKKEYEKI